MVGEVYSRGFALFCLASSAGASGLGCTAQVRRVRNDRSARIISVYHVRGASMCLLDIILVKLWKIWILK